MRKIALSLFLILALTTLFSSCSGIGSNCPETSSSVENKYTPSPTIEDESKGNCSFSVNLSGGLSVRNYSGRNFYAVDLKGESNAVMTREAVDFSYTFTVDKGWIFSEEYSSYPHSEHCEFIKNQDGSYTFRYWAGADQVIPREDFEKIHFVAIPTDTINNGVPTIIINTLNHQEIEDKVNWIEGVYAIVEGDQKQYDTVGQKGTLRIKGRGTTSWSTIELQDKRPYSLKLDEAAEILDMPKNKDWVLVANHSDKSLMRNYISYVIGAKMDGFCYTPRCAYAELYLNNEYKGLYLLVEKIEQAREKVNIKPTMKGDNLSDIMAGSFLVEKESQDRFNSYEQLLIQGVETVIGTMNIKSPDDDQLIIESKLYKFYQPYQYQDPIKNYIAWYFYETDKAISAIRQGDYESYKKYIDVNSFVDYIIFQEVAKNIDGNMKVSIYFYKDKGGKMHIGPLWDFDISYGNADYRNWGGPPGDTPFDFMVLDAVWFKDLLRDPGFYRKLKDRYKELRNTVFMEFLPLIDETAEYIRKAAESNFKRHDVLDIRLWPNPPAVVEANSFDKQVSYLKNWITDRLKWLDSQWL